MKCLLTVLVPGIRIQNWSKLYNSIANSFHGSFEVIFIGPYGLPGELQNKDNVKFIQDWGSPIRCQQIGLTHAQGDYICWASDDGEFFPAALDFGFGMLKAAGFDYKAVVMGKYFEGEAAPTAGVMDKDHYYILSNHQASRSQYLPQGYYMLNVGLVSRKILEGIGGWDTENFEVCPMAYNDLACRLQNMGCKFLIQDEIMFHCTHLPGHAGDHGPIHDAQVDHDEPIYRWMYDQPECRERIEIDLDNWKNSPIRWERRFGK